MWRRTRAKACASSSPYLVLNLSLSLYLSIPLAYACVVSVTSKEIPPAQRKVLVQVARVLQQLVNMASPRLKNSLSFSLLVWFAYFAFCSHGVQVNRGESFSGDGAPESPEQLHFISTNVPRIKQFLENVGTKSLDGVEFNTRSARTRSIDCRSSCNGYCLVRFAS